MITTVNQLILAHLPSSAPPLPDGFNSERARQQDEQPLAALLAEGRRKGRSRRMAAATSRNLLMLRCSDEIGGAVCVTLHLSNMTSSWHFKSATFLLVSQVCHAAALGEQTFA